MHSVSDQRLDQSGWGQTREPLSLLPVFVRSDDDPGEMIGQLRPEQTNPIPANTEIKCTHAKVPTTKSSLGDYNIYHGTKQLPWQHMKTLTFTVVLPW